MRIRPIAPPSRLAAVLLAGAWLMPGAPVARAAGPAPKQPIVIDAAHSHVDYKTNTVAFEDVIVSQADTRIAAERAHASGVGLASSQWTFEGRVRIVLRPRGTLSADRAVVQFHDNRITRATAAGKPARFEQQRKDSGHAAHGEADQIVYDAKDDTMELTGEARMSDGRGVEISGPMLVYDIRDEQLRAASPGAGRRVHITVAPRALHQRGDTPAGKPPGR